MKYNKGQKFIINHIRKGEFYCEAIEDFDTETCTFYPLIDLYDGHEFACRNSLCELIPITEEEFIKAGEHHEL